MTGLFEYSEEKIEIVAFHEVAGDPDSNTDHESFHPIDQRRFPDPLGKLIGEQSAIRIGAFPEKIVDLIGFAVAVTQYLTIGIAIRDQLAGQFPIFFHQLIGVQNA